MSETPATTNGAPEGAPETPEPASKPAVREAPVELPRAGRRLANGCLVVAAAMFASYAWSGVRFERTLAFRAGPAVIALLLLACLRLRPTRRLAVALVVLPALLVVHGFEAFLGRGFPAPATAAARAGRAWDPRPMIDVLEDARRGGEALWPSLRPRLLIKAGHAGVAMAGGEALPLGGISGVPTVLCNEGGAWATYDADEHGFNNPKGMWTPGAVELALLGDSFTQGACVPAAANVGALLRARHPATLNLGMLGNGPLLELAGLEEMLGAVRPKTVLWMYFRNDLVDLEFEKGSPLLLRYLDEPGFRQGLLDRQPAVDEGLRGLVDGMALSAPKWPSSLGALGLTRASTPVWLQDLVMNEQSSSLSSVVRLDKVTQMFISEKKLTPDFALLERVLRRAREVTASWGGTLRFVYLPDMAFRGPRDATPYRFRNQVLEVARAAGLPIIDVHPAFHQQPDVEALRYYPGSHCNEAGYRVIADAILAGLAPVAGGAAEPGGASEGAPSAAASEAVPGAFAAGATGGAAPPDGSAGAPRAGIQLVHGAGQGQDAAAIAAGDASCNGGQLSACHALGLALLSPGGPEANNVRAAAAFDKGCKGGYAPSCNGLGVMLAEGWGVPRDEARAVALQDRACHADVSTACLHVAMAYAGGHGVRADKARAVSFYELGCAATAPQGCIEAAAMYAKGDGVPEDLGKARALYGRSCKDGFQPACASLAQLGAQAP